MSNKTAIQIAIESYKNDGVSFTDWFMDNYQMLLEMEKEQTIQFALHLHNVDISKTGTDILIDEAEQYYNKTYGKI